jgi:hypothetical protein
MLETPPCIRSSSSSRLSTVTSTLVYSVIGAGDPSVQSIELFLLAVTPPLVRSGESSVQLLAASSVEDLMVPETPPCTPVVLETAPVRLVVVDAGDTSVRSWVHLGDSSMFGVVVVVLFLLPETLFVSSALL